MGLDSHLLDSKYEFISFIAPSPLKFQKSLAVLQNNRRDYKVIETELSRKLRETGEEQYQLLKIRSRKSILKVRETPNVVRTYKK